jgi:TonB family protein
MMHLTQKQTPRYKYFLALPLLAVVFFTFSCQKEEELEKEAIAATYEDVQAQINSVSQKINAYRTKYFENKESYQEALATVRAKYFTENKPPTTLSEVELAVFKEVASKGVFKTIESYYKTLGSLRDKLRSLPDAEGVFMMVDHQPEPEGGIKEFYQHIAKNLKYPAQARKAGIEGKVFVQFVVNEYGELTDFQPLKGIGAGCDDAAMEALKSAPAWNPGTTDGKPVKVRMVIPITFKLDDGTAEEKPASEGLSQADQPESNLEEIVAVGYVK